MTKQQLISMARQLKIAVSAYTSMGILLDAIHDAGYVLGVDNKTGDWVALNSDDQVCARIS